MRILLGADHRRNMGKRLMKSFVRVLAIAFTLTSLQASAATLRVGSGKTYSTLAAAVAAAQTGDTVEVDAGVYQDQEANVNKSVIIKGVGGKAHFKWVNGMVQNDKGIIYITAGNVVLENIETSGGKGWSGNISGVRTDGGVTMRNCYVHDNQNGFLSGNDGTSTVIMENCEFDNNGDGSGQNHNIYVGDIGTFSMKYSYSHRSLEGHNVKTRARVNTIAYNRITDETGYASYQIDVPNCGETYIIGNLIHKSSGGSNLDLIAYGAESQNNPIRALYVVNNTFVSDYGSNTVFVYARSGTSPFVLTNNIFVGSGTVSSGATPTVTTNLSSASDPGFVSIGGYNYNLTSGAAGAINHGTAPGTSATGVSLTPAYQYVHPVSYSARPTAGAIDIGAYEYGGITDTTPPTVPAGVTATPVSYSQVNLSWTASFDNVGVAGYFVYRNGAQVGSSYTTSYQDTSVSASTTYTYTVAAYDGGGNVSSQSAPASATTPAAPPLSQNLMAAYAFNEGTGSSVPDASGHGNSGTLSNTTWTTSGKYGNALAFNGTSATVNIPDSASLHLTTGMTLEAWVYPTNVAGAWRDVIMKGSDEYYLEATSSAGPPATGGKTIGGALTGSSALPANTWSHLAGTYDGTTLRLYVNGAEVASRAQTGSIATTTNPLQIGGDSFFGQYFQGMIDEVRVYNRALTPAEIQTDMNTPVAGGGGTPNPLPSGPTGIQVS